MRFFQNILLLLCLLALCKSDPSRIHLKFHCNPQVGTWCGTLIVYEHDVFSEHDIMATDSFCETSDTKELFYEFSPGGDGSPGYEWSYLLSHNCSSHGHNHCLHPKSTANVPVEGLSIAEFEAEVFESGYKAKTCDDPNEPPVIIF
ncbi:hypothetical protein GCK72_022722 [Caenorhabditis remanei]|uniref:Uncharacterized protein n=1 Tax=Caenorhabditis remanei TaxID=31234 RepID=A0A6A5FUX7_CAERE|nr:hypothetical protein GCK72_022722 [Caenorhabditis remanei]KAF1746269.1 hypothetical protein GCK72_022722 [Caenorhabditis remanei]